MKKFVYYLMLITFICSFFLGFNQSEKTKMVFTDDGINSYVITFEEGIDIKTYKELFDKEAKVETIHAGVECGIMAAKITGLDCVSFGPDIRDIHTVKERLDIASTKRTWELIVNVLEKLA